MALLGRVIKTAVELSQALQSSKDHQQAQQKQLQRLLRDASGTAFGKYYNFAGILQDAHSADAFRDTVPIHDYDKIHQEWWAQQQHVPDITWMGIPQFFALSSGTTGQESKRIPVTEAMLESIRQVSLDQIKSLANYDLGPEVFEKEILGIGSSANLQEREGHLEGEISGINAAQAPEWFDFFYRPGKRIASIDDWDDRMKEMVRKAREWDVAAIVGIPSWVLMLLREIVDYYQVDSIHEIWPHLRLYATGGVAFEPFRESFDQLMDQPVIYQDTYLASEGYFAYTARPGTDAMQLALQHGIYYEFIPFDERGFDAQGNRLSKPTVHQLHEVEPGTEYALLVSTVAGTWRYMIGDTVRFTDLKRKEIVITGRTKYFLNVVGSQLSEAKINTAVQHLCEEHDVEMNEFTVGALQENGQWYHQWILGIADGDVNEDIAISTLDEKLKAINKNYDVARSKALKRIELRTIPQQRFYDWMEVKKKKGGQVKVPKVMKQEDLQEFIAFLDD